jgi:ribosomal protein S18 acetylase RimI-like enzyme
MDSADWRVSVRPPALPSEFHGGVNSRRLKAIIPPRMLAFATAEESSMDAFLSVSAASPYQERLREYADSLIRQRCTRPSWCVLGVEEGVPLARAALWALPDEALPTDVVLIDADWNDRDLAGGHALLTRLHELAGDLGADALSHHVDSPPGAPQYQENEDARIRLLTESGYELLRDGLRWRYSPSSPPEARRENSLVFRTLADVGEDVFVDAIASTYQGTRDSWITRSIEELGTAGAARADFVDYQQMYHLPEWWELAYTEDGALAGVIMAARNPSSAVIAYVGVVPEQRGRGLAPHLVRRGTERLLESGATEIRGDCDRDNVGMVKAFERAGFEQFARRRSYRRVL